MACPFCGCPVSRPSLDALLPKVRQGAAWMPISTIPKNPDGDPASGDFLLLVKERAGIPNRCLVGHWMPGGCCIEDYPPIARGWYFWDGHMFDLASEPTHWAPLPEVPDAS